MQRRPCVWRNTHPLLPNPSKSPHCSALRRRLLTRGPAGADAGGPLISSQAPHTTQGGTQGPRQERSVLRALCPLADLCPPEPPSLCPRHPRPLHLLRQQGEPGGHQDKNWRRPPWGCARASESEAIGKMPLSCRLPRQAQREDRGGDTGLLLHILSNESRPKLGPSDPKSNAFFKKISISYILPCPQCCFHCNLTLGRGKLKFR